LLIVQKLPHPPSRHIKGPLRRLLCPLVEGVQHHKTPAGGREVNCPRYPIRVAQPHFPQLVSQWTNVWHPDRLRPVLAKQLADPQEIGLVAGR
jgi:hypothetical protein